MLPLPEKLSPARKALHLSGIVIPLIYLLTDRATVLAVTLLFLVLTVVVEWLRIKGRLNWSFLQKHLKQSEAKRPTGSFFYLVSCLATILLFDRIIAIASICVLCIADPLSSIIGSLSRRKPLLGKSVEGSVTFFLSSLAILHFFSFPLPAVIGASLAATAAEVLSSKFFDDNLSIPIITALALALLS